MSEDRKKAEKYGFASYIAKPFDKQVLLKVIDDLLTKKGNF